VKSGADRCDKLYGGVSGAQTLAASFPYDFKPQVSCFALLFSSPTFLVIYFRFDRLQNVSGPAMLVPRDDVAMASTPSNPIYFRGNRQPAK
jgi:hypothetical protein